ncbi:MAG: hypothetical protein WBA10_19675 [Elainellaceae cyanobacterium]
MVESPLTVGHKAETRSSADQNRPRPRPMNPTEQSENGILWRGSYLKRLKRILE